MTPEEADEVWLERVYEFVKLVGDKHYATVILNDMLATFGYSSADVPDEMFHDDILELARLNWEGGKGIRRGAYRPAVFDVPFTSE